MGDASPGPRVSRATESQGRAGDPVDATASR
jgi:hypothetical protein